MGEVIVIFLKGLASKSAALLSKMLVKILPLLKSFAVKALALSKSLAVKIVALYAALEFAIAKALPGSLDDFLFPLATRIALRMVSENPQVQKAASEMSYSLWQALRTDYLVTVIVFLFCVVLLITFILSPLFYKALSRRRLRIFISFNRAREDIAEDLQKRLDSAGARVFRIPFREGATHQNIVMQATEGIKECDSFVCLPGYTQSYVEHEVLAATTAEKPVAFLISDTGTLPNTADKRYPIFRLEPIIREQFKPLISFLSYVGADFNSTYKLCQRCG